MKRFIACFLIIIFLLSGCSSDEKKNGSDTKPVYGEIINGDNEIKFSDKEITLNGKKIAPDKEYSVYTANDIVFYLKGQDFTYGEGNSWEGHEQSEADSHTVVHITKPGRYVLSGKISAGQVAVDLGEDAESDPNAVVTLVLNNLDITCSVAPAIIFYNVYECGEKDESSATKDVDTKNAGANIIIADGSENFVNGSYVSKIYKPESVVLNETKTEVTDAKKLHKYDAALYSKQSMNVSGEEKGDGTLTINAKNEGLDSELHLTINSGIININSGNDGINTNEDNISVTTINGGTLNIVCGGRTDEGDGIDSNGWIMINGGDITMQACSTSGDSGVDSDLGTYLNGGNLVAVGKMIDKVAGSEQNYLNFKFSSTQFGDGKTYELRNEYQECIAEFTIKNNFTDMIISRPDLKAGEYYIWQDYRKIATAYTNSGAMILPPEETKN